MSYKLNRYVWPSTVAGQYWRGEDIEEHLLLTDCETIKSTVLNYLPQNGRILDAGCGLGRWLIYLWKRGYDIVGMDIEEEPLKVINKYYKEIPLISGDIVHTNFDDCSFDAIISFGVIEHFESGPEPSLIEAFRLLKENGILLVAVPYQNFTRRFVLRPSIWFMGNMLRKLGYKAEFSEYRFSKNDMVNILTKMGFQIIHIEAVDFNYPKSSGLYADWGKIIGDPNKKYELNRFGKIIQNLLRAVSIWTYCEGILLIAKKP